MSEVKIELFNNAVDAASVICRAKLRKGDSAVDCTVGNGNDTALLCELVGEKGNVWGFDIQQEAITKTRVLLESKSLSDRATLICDGHENIDKYFSFGRESGISNVKSNQSSEVLDEVTEVGHSEGTSDIETASDCVMPTDTSFQGLQLILFNLGYMPGGDHNMTTQSSTTLMAVEKSIHLLAKGGVLLLVAYPGHASGRQECIALTEFFQHLDQKQFSVSHFHFLNQRNNPPELYCVEKRVY